MVVERYILYFLLFLIFVLAPFDILMNLNILGFNFRLVGLFVVLFIVMSVFIVLRNRERVILPLWIVLLLVISTLNTLFVFNSILIIRGVFYSLWLWLLVVFVMSSVSVRKLLNPEVVVKIYILSFTFHALFGIVQQVSFYGFDRILFATQPGRMNGFTYEPSYFATYLSAGLPLVVMLSLLSDKNDRHRYLYYIPAGIIISATIISTSKMYIVTWSLVGVCLIFLIASMTRLGKIRSNIKTIMFGVMNVFIASIVSILLINIAILIGSATIGVIAEKTKEVLESSEETSFGPRIEEFMKTVRVALENPIIGTSLGGVAPHKAVRSGVDPKGNLDVKMFEGMSVYAEILAGLGVVGFLIFVAFVLSLTYDSLKTSIMLMKEDEIFRSAIVFSLLSGLLIELVALSFNQNILRFYLWNQIAVLGLVLESYRRS